MRFRAAPLPPPVVDLPQKQARSKVVAGCYQLRFASCNAAAAAINTLSMAKTRQKLFEYVEPIGARVLVRKDEPKRQTKGGIALPDQAEIPTITGRIVAISAQIENDEDLPLRQYDKILFHPKNAIPVDFEADNQLFVVPVEDIVAVFRREPKEESSEE
jgi:chaperonin GroES